MSHNHVTTARDHVAAVIAARQHLAELHQRVGQKGYNDTLGKAIAAQYDAIRTGTRLAEAHAAIAQAQALERIATALEASGRPGPGEAVTL